MPKKNESFTKSENLIKCCHKCEKRYRNIECVTVIKGIEEGKRFYRFEDCHSDCENYIKEKQAYEEIKLNEKKSQSAKIQMIEFYSKLKRDRAIKKKRQANNK